MNQNITTCCKALDYLAYLLVIIGALNWGLVGIIGVDIVELIFNEIGLIGRIIYLLVGVGGIRMLYIIWRDSFGDKCNF